MDEEIVPNVPDQEDSIQRETAQMEESNREQEQRIRKLETKALQNVNLYFIFQAVILMSTATATATSLTCHHWWLPFLVSLLAAVQNFVAFSGAMLRVLKLREELDQDSLDLAFIKLHRITRAQLKEGNENMMRPKPGSFHRWRARLLTYIPIALFLIFSGLLMYGCHILLCNTSRPKCVKPC